MSKHAKIVLWLGLFMIVAGLVKQWPEIRDVLFKSQSGQPVFPVPKQPGGIPGVTGPKTGYPQWGVRITPSGIIKASSRAEKMKDISMGYVVWLKSQQAAQNFLSSQHGFGSL